MSGPPRPKPFLNCEICGRCKPAHVVTIKWYDSFTPVTFCHRCLWVYTYFHQSSYTNIPLVTTWHISQGNVLTPKVIAIKTLPPDKHCCYGELILRGLHKTYLETLPRDMYMAVLFPYICTKASFDTIHAFHLSPGAVWALNCASGLQTYTSGTVVISGKRYCDEHIEFARSKAH